MCCRLHRKVVIVSTYFLYCQISFVHWQDCLLRMVQTWLLRPLYFYLFIPTVSSLYIPLYPNLSEPTSLPPMGSYTYCLFVSHCMITCLPQSLCLIHYTLSVPVYTYVKLNLPAHLYWPTHASISIDLHVLLSPSICPTRTFSIILCRLNFPSFCA